MPRRSTGAAGRDAWITYRGTGFGQAAFIDQRRYRARGSVVDPFDTHDLLRHTDPKHLDAECDDFAHLLFGRAPARAEKGGAGGGRRGRVAFEAARQTGGGGPMTPVTAILASPKAQFYPAYVKRRAKAGATTTARYASYAPVPGATEAHLARPELAGRKRYPIRPWPPAGANPYGAGAAQMGTALHPLPAGARFSGRVRFDNLKPEELGALVWALRLWAPCWGPRPALRHALGMGKPYGFGAVEIELSAARVEANAPAAGGRRNLLANGDDSTAIGHALGYADRFAEHMETAWEEKAGKRAGAGWAASEQIEMLLGLAQEASADDARSLRYLSLADREFTDAKRAQEILAPAPRHAAGVGAPGSATEDTSFPRADTAAPRATAAPPPRAGRFAPGQRVYVVEDGEDATVVEMVGPDRARVRYRDGGTEVFPVSGLTAPR